MSTKRTYTCDDCGGTFEEGWSDEEAHAEAVQNFGTLADGPAMAVVCDDCYRDIMERIRLSARFRGAASGN
jgi:hypothetical protein